MSGSDLMRLNFQNARSRLASSQRLLPPEGSQSRLWKLPPYGVVRLHVDVSSKNDGQTVGVGYILRDHRGQILAAVSLRIGFTETVLMGELHAMLLGIGFCFENDIGLVVLFSDSLFAIHVLHDSYGGSESLTDDLLEAFDHAKKHVVLEFCHVRREGNLAAHSLANFAIISQDVMIWKSNFPSWLSDIVHSDLK